MPIFRKKKMLTQLHASNHKYTFHVMFYVSQENTLQDSIK